MVHAYCLETTGTCKSSCLSRTYTPPFSQPDLVINPTEEISTQLMNTKSFLNNWVKTPPNHQNPLKFLKPAKETPKKYISMVKKDTPTNPDLKKVNPIIEMFEKKTQKHTPKKSLIPEIPSSPPPTKKH